MTIFIIILLVIGILLYIITTYNRFNKYIIKVDEALSGIDVALAKRYDTITKMVEIVKGYSKHEKEVIFEAIKLRQDMNVKERLEENKKMDNNLNKINITLENYPEIKANDNFMLLQKSMIEVEEHLQASRRIYNSNVSIYNQFLNTFPSNIIGKIRKLKEKPFFEAKEEQVKINLK